MALKKKQVELVQVRSVDTEVVITVSKETSEQLFRNKGEYELVKASDAPTDAEAQKAAAKAAKKAEKSGKTDPPADAAAKDPVKPEWPKGSAEEWVAYAAHIGVSTDGLDRNGVHAAVVAHETPPATD